MAETPELRLLESCSIRYHAPVEYPPLDQEVLAEYVLKLQAIHAVVSLQLID